MPTSFSRRDFARIAGTAALGVSATTIEAAAEAKAASAEQPPRSEVPRRFPKTFSWGTATASYQVEGAVDEDGRGASIWDTFAHTSGKIKDGSTGDVAADHYHRYKEDVRLMTSLGAKSYRFSIAWPRVFPEGTGAPNPKGLDFYDRLLDELLASGIEPFATLYHWDLPQALQDRGGWESRDTAEAFAAYAGYVAERLTDRLKHIFTINELWSFVELGYGRGLLAPGLELPAGRLNQVRHHAVLGHGLAVRAIRAKGRAGTKVGPAENISVCVPVIETPEHIRAAEIATRELNAGYLTVILEGRYTDSFLAFAGEDAPKFTAEDLEAIASPVDFVGINTYTPSYYVRATDAAPGFGLVAFPASYPHMASSWLRIGPESLYWAPRHVASIWKVDHIYISENGCSTTDAPDADGGIDDIDRVMFLRNYLTQLQRATSEGFPVRGYFLWSLMDNFEWSDGCAKRFGLHYVDYETQARTPKLSASYFHEVATRNQVL